MKVSEMTTQYHLINIAISLLNLLVLGFVAVTFPLGNFSLIVAFFLQMGWMVFAVHNFQYIWDDAVQWAIALILEKKFGV